MNMSAFGAAFHAVGTIPTAQSARVEKYINGFSVDSFGCIESINFGVERAVGGCRLHFDGNIAGLQWPDYLLGKGKVLLHIIFGLSEGVTAKNPLFAGVNGGRVLAKTPVSAVIELRPEDAISIFYPDGRVALMRHEDIRVSRVKNRFLLKAEHSFDARLRKVEENFEQAKLLEGDNKIVRQDRWMHEIAGMIAMSGNFPELREKLVDFVVKQRIPFRTKVLNHFRDACGAVFDGAAWTRLRIFNDTLPAANVRSEVVMKTPVKTGPSRAELEKRAAANRAVRLAAQPAKGKSEPAPLHGSNKKGKKGKDKK